MATATKCLFTLDDANRALPLVRSIAADLVSEFRALRTAGRERRALEAEGGAGAAGERRAATLAEAVNAASARVEGYLRELAALGLEVRDLELGMVDFPTLMGSEPAFLCWRLGEPTVAWWHSADKGHAERIPIASAVASA
jgi:hypothetical protein